MHPDLLLVLHEDKVGHLGSFVECVADFTHRGWFLRLGESQREGIQGFNNVRHEGVQMDTDNVRQLRVLFNNLLRRLHKRNLIYLTKTPTLLEHYKRSTFLEIVLDSLRIPVIRIDHRLDQFRQCRRYRCLYTTPYTCVSTTFRRIE